MFAFWVQILSDIPWRLLRDIPIVWDINIFFNNFLRFFICLAHNFLLCEWIDHPNRSACYFLWHLVQKNRGSSLNCDDFLWDYVFFCFRQLIKIKVIRNTWAWFSYWLFSQYFCFPIFRLNWTQIQILFYVWIW